VLDCRLALLCPQCRDSRYIGKTVEIGRGLVQVPLTSNPLSSFNWYGDWTTSDGETTDTGLIDWSQSDCGYGIGQITTGMCLAQGQNNDNECAWPSTLTSDQQLAIAIDYQANIVAAAELLVDEWNTLWGLGITPDGTDVPSGGSYANYIGEWYMAIWAYNSGVEPGSPKYGNTTGCTPGPTCTDNGGTGGNWGLGYADNPINPAYPPDRPVFPNSSSNPTPDGSTYSVAWDTSHPQVLALPREGHLVGVRLDHAV
jgi:hypothetical protein